MRHVPVRPEYATLLFDLVEARHLKKSTLVSSNPSVKAWGDILGNPALTASLVDRAQGPDASEERPPELDAEEEAD